MKSNREKVRTWRRTVHEEYDSRLIEGLEEENIFRRLGTTITTSGERKINIAGSKPAAAWIDEGEALTFGDFSYYNIGDRGVRSFAKLKELFAGNGMVGFVAKERVDGKLVLPEAVQILKMGA